MKTRRLVRARVGMGIPELLVAMVVMGIIGIAAIKTFLSQTRFADMQLKRRMARSVSRAPINLLLSEIRMADNVGGVAAASAASGASSITVRVPIGMGLVCGTAGGATVLSMTPADSVALAGASLSGYAYRGANGAYYYTEGAMTVTSTGAATCAGANITTLPGGRVVSVTPLFPGPATIGTPAFLYQRVRFSFAASTILPGRRGLWRTLEATGATEELAAPFDSVSRFRFYRNSNDTADVAVPPLNEISGVELVLTGASEQPRYGRTVPETSLLRTAVFFVNRLN
jgi:Tfp pilus assembly protein PilX